MKLGRIILLSTLAILSLTGAQAQQKSMRGVVVDSNGDAVIGATVKLKNGKALAATDVDGRFSITGVKPGEKIEITYVGMKPQVVTVSNDMQITLVSDEMMLEEVVVTAFGEQKRSAFTGSAAVVQAKTIETKQLTNVMSALQGEAAGVQMVNNSGDPTATPTIRVRGFSSISAGKDPLIIVDGAPFDGGWNNLNPADVASVTVLKDASSTALYGARGANGVIMVTTKRSNVGEAKVSLDMRYGSNIRISRDYETIKDPLQYYETYYNALYNYQRNSRGLDPRSATIAANEQLAGGAGVGGLGYICYTVPEGEYFIGENGRVNPNATLGKRIYNNGNIYTIMPDDWQKEGFRHGFRQEYNMNVNGGNDRMQFYGSLGYLKNEGIAYNSEYERYSARIKADYRAKEWLKVGTNVSFSHSNFRSIMSDSNGLFYQVNNMAPIYPAYIRDANGNIMYDENGRMYDYGDGDEIGLERPVLPNINPLQDNALNTDKSKDDAFSIYGYADITPLKGLKITINGTVSDRELKNVATSNPFYGYWEDNTSGGMISKYTAQTYSYNYQQLINYQCEFGNHHVEALLGHEYYRQNYELLSGTKKNMASYFSNQTLSGAIQVSDTYDTLTDYNSEGFFFRGQYDYDQKYFANISYRRDASSRFHPDHRWGNFYSFGGAWIISREKFMQPTASWLNVLKIKASFGQQGNDKIGDYRYTDTYDIVNSNNQLGLVLKTKGNENITWETNNNMNAGIEFELFGSRLRGNVEYFYKKTTDMLCFVIAPYSSGYKGSYDNIGDMKNAGVEIDLSGTVIKTRDITWDVNFNATLYKNEIICLAESLKKGLTVDGHAGYSSVNNFYGEGLPIYQWYMKRYAGVDEEGKSTWYYTKSDGTLGTTNVYGNASTYLCGDPHPTVYGGFGTSLSAYGFDINVSFTYSLGGKAYDWGYAAAMTTPYSTLGGHSLHQDILNAWTPENTNTDVPRMQYGDENSAATSDRFLTSASYLTLQNVNLGYTLPTKWIKPLGLSNVRIYAAGTNLYYWSARKGFDPRGSFTGDNNNTYDYSPSATISGGLKVTF
ncbi:MAG: SusC/RagA family TonB-linked outer membrane protein [Muribaculaceae bacterium]